VGIIDEAFKKAGEEGQENNNFKKILPSSTNKTNQELNNQLTQQNTQISRNGSRVDANSGVTKSITVKLDWEYIESQGYLTEKTERSQMVEEYRTIKRPLIANAFGERSKGIERANLVLVTSSVPGEGKTFSAINIALSIGQERDKEVLLIDADVAKPSVASALGIDNTPGLIEYLESEDMDFSEVIRKTDLPGFRVVPAGNKHSFSTELLASNKMEKLVSELSQRYSDRIVIFDSPPLLAATQGEVLAALVGQVVVVIEAESTLQATVKEMVSKLDKCDVVLALLNKANRSFDFGSNAYGYGYGYGYGKYGH
jgi:exopolysaccharide/PEP-CTERM locus tyrosine autokinase